MGIERERTAERADTSLSLDSRLLERCDEAFECAARRAVDAVEAADPGADVGTRFEAALSAVLEAAAEQPDLTRLCLVEAPGLGANAVARKEIGLQRFVELVDGELARTGDGKAPPLVSEMVIGGIYEVMQRTARAGKIAEMPELSSQLRALWLPALRGR
ncbi:MAG: hypothetical protein M3N56_08760 [Actinomycetota bacterium]|nr:hypothetical protein [Actinomycetota bacterium]